MKTLREEICLKDKEEMKGMESEQGRAVKVRHEQLLFFTFNSWTLAEGRWTWRAGTLKVSKKELAETQGGGEKVEIQSQLKVKKNLQMISD